MHIVIKLNRIAFSIAIKYYSDHFGAKETAFINSDCQHEVHCWKFVKISVTNKLLFEMIAGEVVASDP